MCCNGIGKSDQLRQNPFIKTSFQLFMLLGVFAGEVPATANPLQAMIDAALESGQKVIRIPAGRYEVAPSKGVHLELAGLRDVTIDAAGVEMICTETTLAINIRNCENLRISGLTIDYDPLPFTQGRIVEIAEDRKSHVIEIMDGFPPAEEAYVFKHAVYTPEGELRFGNYYTFKLEVLSAKRLRIYGLNPRQDGGEQLGDIVVVGTQHLSGRYRPHAVMIENSVGTVMEDVTLYSSPCFGFLEVGCSSSVYRNCVIDRREGRMRSLNADAYHSKYAEVGPQIINCTAMWQGDDCVNICGDYYLVESGEGRKLRLLVQRSFHVQPGDRVELVTPDGRRLPDAKAVSFKRVGDVSEADKAFFNSLELNAKVKAALRTVYSIELDREVDLPRGSVLASTRHKGNGFVVKDCTFGNNRSRGILIKAGEGEVSGNTLINTHSEAIKLSPEYHWLESGFSRNVVIRDNRITNSHLPAIRITGVGSFTGHENIQVLNNEIQTGVFPAIQMESVRDGSISNNTILGMDGGPVANAIRVRHCENVEIAVSEN